MDVVHQVLVVRVERQDERSFRHRHPPCESVAGGLCSPSGVRILPVPSSLQACRKAAPSISGPRTGAQELAEVTLV
jgi:hypothetical protein